MKPLYNCRKIVVIIALLLAGITITNQSAAQQDPFGASYFLNQYLANPAMVGGDNKVKAGVGYRRQWAGISNSPYSLYATGEYSSGDKINLGISLYNDRAGMLNTSMAMATYAYYLPVTSTGGRVHLGISAGAVNRRIDTKNFNGDPGDVLLTDGNNFQFDGGIGVAYTDKRITVQASFPNMVTYFKKENEDLVNRPTFFAAASYKLAFNDGDLTVEPKAAFRGMQGFDNIIDAGANIALKQVNVFGIYHSSKNITAGAGLKIADKLVINAIYTSAGAAIREYIDGNFEVGLSFSLGGKEK
jgi:type IX secretion system PorP/SprF family membrane protein